jgi:hypothetical protein
VDVAVGGSVCVGDGVRVGVKEGTGSVAVDCRDTEGRSIGSSTMVVAVAVFCARPREDSWVEEVVLQAEIRNNPQKTKKNVAENL